MDEKIVQTTDVKVRNAAEVSSDVKKALETLFPEVFVPQDGRRWAKVGELARYARGCPSDTLNDVSKYSDVYVVLSIREGKDGYSSWQGLDKTGRVRTFSSKPVYFPGLMLTIMNYGDIAF